MPPPPNLVTVDAPRVLDLARFGDRVALHTGAGTMTYADLAGRVAGVGERLGSTRRLVLVEGTNTVESLTTYLAALTYGHVVLLSPPGGPARQLARVWDPDVVATGDRLHIRRPGTVHDLHPDLGLLLSTSGSTGSPKLVRLSHENLRANAASIAEYLQLSADDRAVTSLPLHYCYGLSVVNSHLLVGAGVVLTDLSVVDECFWQLAEHAGATSFAAVPYTFDLLERSGFERRRLSRLRYVTQAGGRLDPERVREWHRRGSEAGWDLVVMYGQTEATARMAWLPPALAQSYPETVGVPVPGGSFRLEPVPETDDPEVGELVYHGPNVMLGYAARDTDLALGATLGELRTGDLARQRDGLWEIVGRRDRQVKVFGLRLELGQLERQLVGTAEVRCVVVEGVLHVFTARPRVADRLRDEVARATGLPESAVRVTTLRELPSTESGKPDLGALRAHAERLSSTAPAATTLRDEYALVLGRPDASPSDSFVSLGGDSLSYVELATRLTDRVGELPPQWHTRPISALEAPSDPRPGTWLDTSVVLRAVAILAIVGTHANLWNVVGGAHVLLAVAGWNFARFQLAAGTRAGRIRHGLASLVHLTLPSTLWIGGVALVTGYYTWLPAAYLNGFVGSERWTTDWQFWFLESLVWFSLAALTVLALPAVDRWERRSPYGFVLALTVAALGFRYWSVGVETDATQRYTIALAAWFVLLGWLGNRADTRLRRWTVVALCAVGCLGFFGDPVREALIVAGVALLVCVPTVPVPRLAVGAVSVLASSSLFVYVTHWQVYPWLEDSYPLLATGMSFAVGIGYWWATRPALREVARHLRRPVATL